MDDEILDLGQGSLLIGELAQVDLSNLETLIVGYELSNVEEIELDITK